MVSHEYMHDVGMVAVVTGAVWKPNRFRIVILGRLAEAARSLDLSNWTALRRPPPTLAPNMGAALSGLRAALAL